MTLQFGIYRQVDRVEELIKHGAFDRNES